jgi:hypothetical protein
VSVMVFQEMLTTVDYPSRKLVMERGELPEPDNRTVLPFQRSQAKMRIPVKVGGSEAWVCLWSLYHGPLSIPAWAAKTFPGASDAKEVTFKGRDGQPLKLKLAALTEDIIIGEHRLSKPNASLSNFDEPVLGAPYLKEFSITFDLKNNRVRMTRANRSPLPPVPFFENKLPKQQDGPNVQVPVKDDQG